MFARSKIDGLPNRTNVSEVRVCFVETSILVSYSKSSVIEGVWRVWFEFWVWIEGVEGGEILHGKIGEKDVEEIDESTSSTRGFGDKL